MFKQVDYIIITVSDMMRSIRFYRDKLGLAMKFDTEEWTEFQTGATTLALHGNGAPQASSIIDEQGKAYAGTCSIGFTVDNLEKIYEDLKAKDVNFLMPPTERLGEGIKLAVCLDPDGLPISLAEMLFK